MRERARHAFVIGLAVALVAMVKVSRAQEPTRCDQCHMNVREDSIFRAGGELADGTVLRFDTPKCFFRFHFDRGPIRSGWMIDRPTREQRPAEGMHYLIGTDRMGPMGPDLLPVESAEHARTLAEAHRATGTLRFEEVTRDVIEGLFRARRR